MEGARKQSSGESRTAAGRGRRRRGRSAGLGVQSSPAARRAAFARAASLSSEAPRLSRAGRALAPAWSAERARFSRRQGPALLHHSARRAGSGVGKDNGAGVGFLEPVSARIRRGGGGVRCGRRRPPPLLSPYRTRGTPAVKSSALPSAGKEAGRVPHRSGEGRGGSARARGGGGGSGRGRGAGPGGPPRRPSLFCRSLRGHQAQAPPPHCPAIFGAPCTHTRTPPPPTTTADAAHDARLAPLKRELTPPGPAAAAQHPRPGLAAGPSPRASPPSPRHHAPLELGRARAVAGLTGSPRAVQHLWPCQRRRPLPQRAKPLSSPRLPRRRRR